MGTLRHAQYHLLIHVVKWFPVLMQFVLIFSELDYWLFSSRYSGWVYPLLGHSFIFDALLLMLSWMLKFCLWHKLLVASLIYNVVMEWLLVNFDFGEQTVVTEVWQFAVSLMFILCAIIANRMYVCPEEVGKEEQNHPY